MINNVVLVGRLTKDPDLKYTPNGVAVVTFTLAVNRNFKNQSGNREADFINCVLWRKSAEALADFTRKGTLIGVEGRIQTRNYENQQGQRVYVTEVIAERFQLLESNNSSENQSNGSTQNQNNVGQNNVDSSTQTNEQVSQHQQTGFFGPGTTNSGDFTSSGTAIDVDDDDLPF